MTMFARSRTLTMGAGFAALLALGGSQDNLVGSAQAQDAGDVMVPMFEVDPLWPKPLPNGWVIGMTIGLSADKNDNIWILHRPNSLERTETLQTRKEADCCTAAPDVLEFNEAGTLEHHWGKDPGHDWPSSNHGLTVDNDGNVWIGANSAAQPAAFAPGSAAQFAPRGGGGEFNEGGGEKGKYHDSFILKFTQDGKYLGQIGHANGSTGSLDTENVRGVATIRFLPATGELVAADGYGNHRVSVWDAKTMKFKRMWGAYGKPPSDDPIPHFNPDSPQFGNPVHCAEPSNDGMLYVCDRTNSRVQIFKFDGTYVKQFVIEGKTQGGGSAWEIAFSKDPQQKFLYLTDGSNMKVHVIDRASMKELYWFGGGGRQPGLFYAPHSIVTDSKGNIFTTETYRGQRVQKFLYKGLVPLKTLLARGVVGGSHVGAPTP